MNVQAFDFAAARQSLVDCQVRVNDVTDKHIQAAYRRVPREAFAPSGLSEAVYSCLLYTSGLSPPILIVSFDI